MVASSGCSGSDDDQQGTPAPNIVQPGAPGEPARTLTPEELDALEPQRHTAEDVEFMQAMIHHHAQALWMTSLVEKRSKSRDIALLARRIEVSQESEIAQMQSWLEARGEEAPVVHRAHGHAHGVGARLMPGMLSDYDMNRLQAARGIAFDRLFLQSMIRHHEGAVTMVNRLFARRRRRRARGRSLRAARRRRPAVGDCSDAANGRPDGRFRLEKRERSLTSFRA